MYTDLLIQFVVILGAIAVVFKIGRDYERFKFASVLTKTGGSVVIRTPGGVYAVVKLSNKDIDDLDAKNSKAVSNER
ncbi:MAG: hypothetical protein OEW37_00105 [Rhodospirillaceae bacterium]|nr:hypothetical protein [Rhodospirillaceae bacterium]